MSGQESDGDMTSQQPADDELAFPDLKAGNAWGESITKQRAAELEAILQEWDLEKEHGERKGPFHVKSGELLAPLTGADVFWLAQKSGPGHLGAAPNLHLEGADIRWANLEAAELGEAHLEGAYLMAAQLQRADLIMAHLENADLVNAQLERTSLFDAHLEGADLSGAHLVNAYLSDAHLEGACLWDARLDGVSLDNVHLEGARLQGAFLNDSTRLNNAILGNSDMGYISLADVRWHDVNMAVVDWTQVRPSLLGIRKRIEAIELGDEREARRSTDSQGKPKSDDDWIDGYKDAVRANRQLATALRGQGLNEDADRFAYKAQKLQREVLRRQRRYGSAFGSWLLDAVAGYGYKPMRTLTVYLLAIITFAIAYFALGQTVGPHLSPLGAFVFSMTSFHGRGFFPGGIVLDDPITVLAAFEAFIGLVIEVSFIATFTQRFFAR